VTEGRQGGQGCEHRWVDAKRCYDCGEVVSDDAGGGRRRETPDGGWAEEKARELLQRLVDTVIGDPSSAVEAGTCAMDAMATTIAREERLAAALREAEERGKDIVRRADAMLTPEQLVVYDSMHEAELKAQARRDAFREAALEVARTPWWEPEPPGTDGMTPRARPANEFGQDVARRLRAKAEE